MTELNLDVRLSETKVLSALALNSVNLSLQPCESFMTIYAVMSVCTLICCNGRKMQRTSTIRKECIPISKEDDLTVDDFSLVCL